MKKSLVLFLLLLMPTFVMADIVMLSDAEITGIQYYGSSQTTVFFNKSHGLSCGVPSLVNAVAFDRDTADGKSRLALFMMAYASKKLVTIFITNDFCNGDRPTIEKDIRVNG